LPRRYERSEVIAFEGVGDLEDARADRNVVAAQPERVAAAVGTLVMRAHDLGRAPQRAHRRDDLGAGGGVLCSVRCSSCESGPALPMIVLVVGPDLARFVDERGVLDLLDLAFRQPQPACEPHRVLGDPQAVLARVGVDLLEHLGERAHEVLEVGLELDVERERVAGDQERDAEQHQAPGPASGTPPRPARRGR